MREKFTAEDLNEATPQQSNTSAPAENSHRVNLKDRLALKPAFNNPASAEPEATTEQGNDQQQPEPSTGTTEPKKESATFEETETTEEQPDNFEKFSEKVEDLITDEDIQDIAEMFVSFGNVIRMIFLPGLYEGFTFPGQERNDIRDVVRRSIANKQANKDPQDGFNDYDKELYEKWPKLQDSIKNVSYSDTEIKKAAKYLTAEIGKQGAAVFIRKHMFWFYILYLETIHGKDIISMRVQSFWNKKFRK